VHFMDVGQGDAILLVAEDAVVLIDAGRYDRNDVVPYLSGLGIERIHLFVATHPDADHIGQCDRVMQAFVVLEVWMPGTERDTQTFERCLRAILQEGALYYEPRAGQIAQIGSLRLEVLHPGSLSGISNNDSIVVRINYGSVHFLFTGDIEAQAETQILLSGRPVFAQVLKVAHHGSSTSSTLAFLQAVAPQIAVYSAGLGNPYGHPPAETVAKSEALAIPSLG